jgi:hypothetical protein
VQREVVDAFDLQILYDKAQQQVEVSATVSEAVADAFEDGKDGTSTIAPLSALRGNQTRKR